MAEPTVIAVIDSGVHAAHPHIDAARLLPGVTVQPDGTQQSGAPDLLGHGTAVTAAIQELAPDALILPVRVFREALRASARALVNAIAWADGQGAGWINCSLGTLNPAHAALFDAAVARCRAQIVAPIVTGEGAPCWPGQSVGTITVALDWDLPRGEAERRDGHWHANGHPRPIPGVPQTRNLHGVSFATAQVCGLLAAGRSLATDQYL